MRQRVRVKHGYGKEYFFLAEHLHKAAVGNSAYVRGQANIQSAFSQCLFEGSASMRSPQLEVTPTRIRPFWLSAAIF